MNILEAVKDPKLFRLYLQDTNRDIKSWRQWLCCLRVIYGLGLQHQWQRDLVKKCTGRNPDKLPKRGFRTVLLLCGRRSGKSKIAGLIAAYEAALSGRQKVCSPGEIPCVSICSPRKEQSAIIKSYARAALSSDILDQAVSVSNRDEFKLVNGVLVRILTGSFVSARSYTQLAVVADEICFFGSSEESKVKSDLELIRSIRPSLLTTKGRLICVSSKYTPSGWAYQEWKKHFGKDTSKTLIWDAASTTMNPTLSQADIDAEIKEDPTSAKAEYLNMWRDDVSSFLPVETIEACVVKGRRQLLRDPHTSYHGFVDISGGRSDSAALAIGHKKGRTVILDYLREWKAPFSPTSVVRQIAEALTTYGLRAVTGDAYAAQFTFDAFRANNVVYIASEKPKSQLYLELIGPICSNEIELLDDERSVAQLAALERRTRSGGRDGIDHPVGQHDDLSNVIAGVATSINRPRRIAGGWRQARSIESNTGNQPRRRLGKFLRDNHAKIC